MKEKSEEMLMQLRGKIEKQKLDITGLTYLQLYAVLQQLHMQGEHTVVIDLCEAITQRFQ